MDLKLIPEKYNIKKNSETTAFFSQFSAYLVFKANFLLSLSLILLTGAVLGYFGILGYKNNLSDNKEVLASNMEALQKQRDLDLEANFMELKDGINVLKDVLKGRFYSSRIFGLLEDVTLANVRIVDLQADLSQMELVFQIEAMNYNTLAKQFIVFKEDARVKKADISEIALDELGRVNSRILLEINSDFLRD